MRLFKKRCGSGQHPDAPRRNRRAKAAVLLSASAFLLVCCGLMTFYYLEPPIEGIICRPWVGGEEGIYSGDDSGNQVSFTTNETENTQGGEEETFEFLGTDVYYKIYNNYTTMQNARNAIDSRNNRSDVSGAADYIINAPDQGGRGYQRLQYGNTPQDTFIPVSSNSNGQSGQGQNRHVTIRLSDSSDDDAYPANVQIGDTSSDSGTDNSTENTPKRAQTVPGRKGFNFKSDDNNPVPSSGDDDAVVGDATSEGWWFVDLWAFSVGRDTTNFEKSYSALTDLGYVVISEDWYDD